MNKFGFCKRWKYWKEKMWSMKRKQKRPCVGALEMSPRDRIDGWLSFLFLAGISVQLLICVQTDKYECFSRTNRQIWMLLKNQPFYFFFFVFVFGQKFGRYQFMLLKFVVIELFFVAPDTHHHNLVYRKTYNAEKTNINWCSWKIKPNLKMFFWLGLFLNCNCHRTEGGRQNWHYTNILISSFYILVCVCVWYNSKFSPLLCL